MRSRVVVLAVALALVFTLSVCAGGNQEKQAEQERQAIAAIWEQYCDAVERGDAEQFLALHEDMAYKMPPQAPMFLIKDAAPGMRKSFPEEAELFDTQMDIDWEEIIIKDDVAWSMGTYMIKSTPKNGDPPSVVDGKFLTVLRKDAEAGWKIYRDCYNTNTPPSM